MSNESYDLTKTSGLKAAMDFFDTPWGKALFPGVALLRGIFGQSDSDVSPAKQAEAAEKIIEAGRKNGAKKIRFKVDKQTGLKLKGNVGSDANLEASLGQDGKMEIEIEYK